MPKNRALRRTLASGILWLATALIATPSCGDDGDDGDDSGGSDGWSAGTANLGGGGRNTGSSGRNSDNRAGEPADDSAGGMAGASASGGAGSDTAGAAGACCDGDCPEDACEVVPQPEGAACQRDAECEDENCEYGLCRSFACSNGDEYCVDDIECCSRTCRASNTCDVCVTEGRGCVTAHECCPTLRCTYADASPDTTGVCTACAPNGDACKSSLDCCFSECSDGVCGGCREDQVEEEGRCCTPNKSACTNAADCCSSSCYEGVCGTRPSFACEEDDDCAFEFCAQSDIPDWVPRCCVPPGRGDGPGNVGCSLDAECCSGQCLSGECGTLPGGSCESDDECAAGLCADGVCCARNGASIESPELLARSEFPPEGYGPTSLCCGGLASGTICYASPRTGGCEQDEDCLSHRCVDGACECGIGGETCTTFLPEACCSDVCTSTPARGVCEPGGEGCVPNCTGRECGSDGCGGSCGACASGETCHSTGVCSNPCNCNYRDCGADSCGEDSCGACGSGETCSNGTCVPAPGSGPGTPPSGVNACLRTRETNPTGLGHCDGEIVGYFTNTCSTRIECTICPAYSATEWWEEKCHLTTLAAGQTKGGELSGQWWCGIASSFWGWRVVCK